MENILQSLRAGSITYVPIFFLFGIGFMMFAFLWLREIKLPAKMVAVILGGLIVAAGILSLLATADTRWTVLFSLLPAVIIIAFGVLRFNTRQPSSRTTSPPDPTQTTSAANTNATNAVTSGQSVPSGALSADAIRRVEGQVEKRINESFSPAVIAYLYGVPALLCAAIVSSYMMVLFVPWQTGNGYLAGWAVFRDGAHANLLVGARYGAVGAYAATLLFIGERAIRRELTNGAAVWAVILLALGPMLAAAVAAVYLESSRPTNDVSPWSHAVVYIVAGMSPKWIVGVLTEAAHRLLADRSSPSGNRLVPLTQLRGVTDEIASRLGEESILDSRLMAMADPVILFRNTNYPRRAILDWIDEAMLITTLPESWQAIERAGITGAIDLAWLWLGTQFEAMRGRNPDLPPPGAPTPGGLTATQQLAALANEARIDVGLLSGVAQRFAEDAQVQLIWYLYRYEDEVPIEVLAQRAQPAP